MIDPQKMMPGNWVQSKKRGMFQVDLNYLLSYSQRPDKFEGEYEPFHVPIDESVLLACGFKKYTYPDHNERTMRNMWYIKCGYVQITFAMGETILAGKTDSDVDGQVILSKSIKLLHQLQNLYHSLTGEELVYSPTK